LKGYFQSFLSVTWGVYASHISLIKLLNFIWLLWLWQEEELKMGLRFHRNLICRFDSKPR
jgi:hypothetical protein